MNKGHVIKSISTMTSWSFIQLLVLGNSVKHGPRIVQPRGEELELFIHQLPSVTIWKLLPMSINSLTLQASSAHGRGALEPQIEMHSKIIHVLAAEILPYMH